MSGIRLYPKTEIKMITGNIISHYNQNEELTNQMSCSMKMTDYLSFSRYSLSFSVLSVTPKVSID